MLKYLLIFIAGLIETFLYTGYIIAVQKRQRIISSILMFVYMSIYLTIVSYIIKDMNTTILLLVYAFSCGIGNCIRIIGEHHARN